MWWLQAIWIWEKLNKLYSHRSEKFNENIYLKLIIYLLVNFVFAATTIGPPLFATYLIAINSEYNLYSLFIDYLSEIPIMIVVHVVHDISCIHLIHSQKEWKRSVCVLIPAPPSLPPPLTKTINKLIILIGICRTTSLIRSSFPDCAPIQRYW